MQNMRILPEVSKSKQKQVIFKPEPVIMELRKYQEFEELPKLRVLKKPVDNKEPIKSFVIMIILIISVIATIAVVSSGEEHETEETLQEFVEESITENGDKPKKFVLSKTTKKQVEMVKKLTGIDVTNYKWTLINWNVRHICNKPAHGISMEEFIKIYSVLNAYDYFALANKQKKDVISIEIHKILNYKLTCIVEVRTGRKELVIITMYKNRLK